jgi:hypothetical protein
VGERDAVLAEGALARGLQKVFRPGDRKVIGLFRFSYANASLTRCIAGWVRFLTLTQFGDRPAR